MGMRVERVAVLGAGTMGHGIAQAAAAAGYRVALRDVSKSVLDGALEQISWSVSNLARKGRLAEDEARAIPERIFTTVDLGEAVTTADLVIEAAPEDLDRKLAQCGEVDRLDPEHSAIPRKRS